MIKEEFTKDLVTNSDWKCAGSASDVPRGGVWGNVLVIGFLALLLGLSIRSQIISESRFGWGMFSRNIEYVIRYEWVFADGSRGSYTPGDELQGKAKYIAPRKSKSFKREGRNTRYDIGTIRQWIRTYLSYLFKNKRPPNAVSVEAKFYFAINQLQSDPTPPKVEVIRYP